METVLSQSLNLMMTVAYHGRDAPSGSGVAQGDCAFGMMWRCGSRRSRALVHGPVRIARDMRSARGIPGMTDPGGGWIGCPSPRVAGPLDDSDGEGRSAT